MSLTVEPATPDRWDDVAAIVGGTAVARNCWCAFWYASNADYKANWGAGNAAVLEALVRGGGQPGIVGYVDGAPAAWVSVAPRRNFDRLNRSKNFAAIDDVPVWAVNCFVVMRPFRGQGLMPQLAAAAADFAFARGAPAVEGYPMEPGPKTGAGDLFLGTVRAFAAAGFHEVARPLPRRAIMRKLPA